MKRCYKLHALAVFDRGVGRVLFKLWSKGHNNYKSLWEKPELITADLQIGGLRGRISNCLSWENFSRKVA